MKEMVRGAEQQTARGVEESAVAAAQLADQPRELQNLVGRFRLA